MRKWIFPLAAVLAMACVSESSAYGPYPTVGSRPYQAGTPRVGFMAAPWYLYWPYDAHFMTPAPVYGAYYPPPNVYGSYSMPYFPTQPVPLTNVLPAGPVGQPVPIDPVQYPQGY